MFSWDVSPAQDFLQCLQYRYVQSTWMRKPYFPATYFVDSYRMFFQQQIRAFEMYSHNIHPQKNPWNEV